MTESDTKQQAPAASRSSDGLSGAELIQRERARQISMEGWSAEHDDSHRNYELAQAGACYAAATVALNKYHRNFKAHQLDPPMFDHLSWPWGYKWWKPSDDPIKNLVKAGALIAAEIDRLNRVKRKQDNV